MIWGFADRGRSRGWEEGISLELGGCYGVGQTARELLARST